jgi:hypothetical protein
MKADPRSPPSLTNIMRPIVMPLKVSRDLEKEIMLTSSMYMNVVFVYFYKMMLSAPLSLLLVEEAFSSSWRQPSSRSN